MSEYFANDPECYHLLACALRSHRVAGLGGYPTVTACWWSHVHVDSGPVVLCGPAVLWPCTLCSDRLTFGSLNRNWCHGLRLPSGSVYQASLLPCACKPQIAHIRPCAKTLHSACSKSQKSPTLNLLQISVHYPSHQYYQNHRKNNSNPVSLSSCHLSKSSQF